MPTLIRSDLDTLGGVSAIAYITGLTLLDLRGRPDAFERLSEYREEIEERLQELDARMCVATNDEEDRTLWASRMRTCHAKLRTITLNLAVWGKPEWSWEEVAEAGGYLRAVADGARCTLALSVSQQEGV